MASQALLLAFLLCNTYGANAAEDVPRESATSSSDKEQCVLPSCSPDEFDADLTGMNLMQTRLESRQKQTESETTEALGRCKSWCARKATKGMAWEELCMRDSCSTCIECPVPTTTTTTTTATTTTSEYNPYCSGVPSLMQKGMTARASPAVEDPSKRIERENQAMSFHHSYCGRSHRVKSHGHKSSSSRPGGISRDDCAAFTSTRSPNGLENCDGEKNMPYAYAYHLHPTYDHDSKDAAKKLQEAFQANFHVEECTDVDESTTYSTNERVCLLSTAKNCNKNPPESPEDVAGIFPLCQFGIYVRGGAMFDDTLGDDGTSPWQWMSLNKDCFGSPLDVLGHAVLCPSLAHGKWAFFVNGTHETTAATWITGDNSVDGCYGQTCQPAECEVAPDVVNGSAVFEALCCAVTALEVVPTDLDVLMAKTYSNVLKFQTSTGWWDVYDETMKDASSYSSVFPSTVFPGGVCHGVCSDLE